MFEKEIEFIYSYYLNKIEKLSPFVTFDQLASANLHPALLQYVSAEIDYLIFEDRQKLLKESLFDYSGDKINEYFTKISQEIKLTKKFSKDYISKLLLHATSFNVNYVVRPNWSLIQFIFESEEEKYVSEVKQILNYLYYYPYYKRILTNYFNRKHLYKISEEELSGVLDKIDKINLENNYKEIVDESLANIVDFINIGEVGNNKIAKDVIEYFLIDKNFEEPTKILEGLTSSSDDKYKVEEYREIILSLQEKEEEPVEDSTEEEPLTEESEEEVQTGDETKELDEDTSTGKEIIEEENELEDKSLGEKAEVEEERTPEIEAEKIEENKFEPPELDEDARIEDTDIQEVYDMATEEEEIDDIELDEPSVGERLNINEDEAEDPYLKELDEVEEEEPETLEPMQKTETKDEIVSPENGEDKEEKYVIHGTSVSFSDEDFGIDEPTEPIEETEKPGPSKLEDLWDDGGEIISEEDISLDNIEEENIEVENVEQEEHTTKEIPQPQIAKRRIDISELLGNKKITKIIENVFDYDVDAFEKTIEKISACEFEVEALQIVDDIARNSYLGESSKEIKTFKKIVSDLFE